MLRFCVLGRCWAKRIAWRSTLSMGASRTQLSTGRFRSSVPWLEFDPSSWWLALDLDSCAICDIDMLNIFSRSQNSVNLNKSVPAKIDRLSKVPDWDQFVWRYILKRMRSDMFGVVSFPPLWNLFLALTVRYFTQMCALKILKTLIWLPTHLPKAGAVWMHFQLSLSPKWVQSRVQWAVGGSANKHFPRDLDPLWTVEIH